MTGCHHRRLGHGRIEPARQHAQTFRLAALAVAAVLLGGPTACAQTVEPKVPISGGGSSGSCHNAPESGQWLSTDGAWITQSPSGCRIRLEGATWYGMQTQYYVPAGLDHLSLRGSLARIKALGFNSIRIPISDQMVRDSSRIRVRLRLGKSFALLDGLHPLQVLDLVVAQAQKDGLWIILDNHSSPAITSREIHSPEKPSSPLWTAPGYNQRTWIRDWTSLAQRYAPGHYCGVYAPALTTCRNIPTVIGFDLRNEPHTDGPGPWDMKTYLTQGAVWGDCTRSLCGKYSKLWRARRNWPAAVTTASNRILRLNPHLLMLVEGVQLYPAIDRLHPGRVDSYWWGSILQGVRNDPIHLATTAFDRQIVYSPHEWGPLKFRAPVFYQGTVTYKSLTRLFYRQWAFVLHLKPSHPIWLGEFNTCNGVVGKGFSRSFASQCARSPGLPGSQGWWFQVLARFLRNNPEVGWSYFPINGTNSDGEPSANSILYASGAADRNIMSTLRKMEAAPLT